MILQTETLDLAEAKNLLKEIQNPGKDRRWRSVPGLGGSEVEERFSFPSVQEYRELKVPDYCLSFGVFNEALWEGQDLPDQLLICGDDWQLLPGGSYVETRMSFVHRELGLACLARCFIATDGLLLGEDYSGLGKVELAFEPVAGTDLKRVGRAADDVRTANPRTDSAKCREFIERYFVRKGLLGNQTKQVAEVQLRPLAAVIKMDQGVDPWVEENYRGILKELHEESADGPVGLHCILRASRIGEFWEEELNISDAIKDLHARTVRYGFPGSFKGNYLTVKNLTWAQRERVRKKGPQLEKLGVLELKEAGVAVAKLEYRTGGYVLSLDFESEETAPRFEDSSIFELTTWSPVI